MLARADVQAGVEIALNRPYSLQKLNEIRLEYSCLKREEIGHTVLKNPIYCFTISSAGQARADRNVFIFARQHPCESVSSLICEQLLLGLSERAGNGELKDIRWHVFPMVNPDGVELGNTRSNLAGYDINRCWAPHLFAFSLEAASISAYLKRTGISCEDIVVDLHGHSRDLGCFCYHGSRSQEATLFNRSMAEKCPFFEENKSLYGVHEVKKSCLRSYVQKYQNIKRCITLETSLKGY